MAIGGWRSLREVERYTRGADQIRLADHAVASLDRGRKNTNEV
jgi:hypothetical protein